ncbi:hypothetical protein ACQCN2_13770 [Brevibacillus ginsengisoli]|uniref:hypothetical protein n=1 Tax=Brevibacillus ginsengisoli TaxID=363854 RepID=UPI003CF17664
MSLKALELQVALPRTQDISRIQEQQQNRHALEQQVLIGDRKQFDQLTRQRATNVNESTGRKIKDDHEEKEHGQNHQQAQSNQPDEKKSKTSHSTIPMTDPLRGHYIDISL